MQSEFELDDQQIQDGLAFAEIMDDERAWAAIARLIGKFNADAISHWADNPDGGPYSKKWLRGYRQAISDFMPRMAQMAQDSLAHLEAAKQAKDIVKSKSEEGLGSGDLAIA